MWNKKLLGRNDQFQWSWKEKKKQLKDVPKLKASSNSDSKPCVLQ